MKKKVAKKLDFSSEKKKKNRQLKYFLISFSVFIIVLGTISLLMFMKSLDFDFNNLSRSSEETTTEIVSESTLPQVNMSGQSNILLLCTGADNTISFSCLIKADMSLKSIVVYSISNESVSTVNGSSVTFNEHYRKFGVNGFVKAAESFSGLTVDRYIKVNETQFKAFANKCGDVVVEVPSEINSNQSGGLYLDAGKQSLSGDLLVKYIKYSDNNEKSNALSAFVKTVLSLSNIKIQDSLFSYLANNSDTNISIVDFTESKEKISAFVQNSGSVNSASDISELSGDNYEEKD